MNAFHKYMNKPVMVLGMYFDSQKEGRRYKDLNLMEKAGLIGPVGCQPIFILQEAFKDSFGKAHRAITYRGDFQYQEGKRVIVEDVKGMKTEAYKIKKKLFIKKYPHIELREIL